MIVTAKTGAASGSALPGRIFVAALLALLAVLIVLPVVVLALGSFLSAPPRALQIDWSGLTLGNYVEVLTKGGFAALVGTTLAAALAGTAGAPVLGRGAAPPPGRPRRAGGG